MIVVFNSSSATADPFLDGTAWAWTWSATPSVAVADPIVCRLRHETLGIPTYRSETLNVPSCRRETLGIPTYPRETLRC